MTTTVAALAVLALVAAGCTGEDDAPGGDASGRTQSSSAAWSPEDVPPLEAVVASGPVVPVFDGSLLDGSVGSATSTRPLLRWPGATGGPFRFEVTDLGPDGGRVLWDSGEVTDAQVRVPDDVLVVDRAYRWTARTRAGAVFGPFLFRVDVRRDDVQPVESVAGVGVARGTGEPVLDWSSPTVESLAGPVGFSIEYRPSNPERPGLPAGWRLRADTGRWDRLVDNGDGSLTLEGATGLAVVFERVEDSSSYRAVWGAGQTWPTGQFATLVRNDDGTFTAQDTGGAVTSFSDPTQPGGGTVTTVWRAGQPSVVQEWRDGRLVGLADSVTGTGPGDRRVRIAYGGDESCPNVRTDLGFVAPPPGQLCGAELWDGTLVAIGWIDPASAELGPRPARLVGAAGTGADAQVTDLSFDASGRLAAVRSPLATAAVAAGVRTAGQDVTTTIVHDDRGRVAAVAAPAPAPGRERPVTSFEYEVVDGLLARSRVVVAAVVTSQVDLDPATFQATSISDPVGRPTRVTWDRARSTVLEVAEPGDLVTRTTYDDVGNPTSRVGPGTQAAIDSQAAPATDVTYDRTYSGIDDREGTPRRGLAVTYWVGDTFRGDPSREEVGPTFGDTVPSEYYFTWNDSPVGSPAWSARLTGVLRVPGPGRYGIQVDPGPTLFVDDVPCRPTCDVDATPDRPVRIRMDVSTQSTAASVSMTWTGPGVSGNVPSSVLSPAVGLQAGVAVRDSFRAGERSDALGRTVWSDPVAGIVGETWSSGGITRRATTEPYRPAEGRFARVTAYGQPSGAVRGVEYHPATDPVADPCAPDRRAVQGGLVRASVDARPDGSPGGLRSEQVHDAAGRVVAARSGSSGWTCSTYDGAGRLVVAETRLPDGGVVSTTRVDHAGTSTVGDDPLVRTTTIVDATGTHTSSVTVDLLGREVTSVDLSGTRTVTTHDPLHPERVVTVVTTPAGGAPSTSEFRWTTDGQVADILVDGRSWYAVAYDDLGRTRTVTHGNGAVATYLYDANGRPTVRSVRTPTGATFAEEQALSPAGRTLLATLRGPSGTARYAYDYDQNARLVGATLQTDLPVSATSWGYTYDPNSNLTGVRTTDATGAVTDTSFTVDGADRLTSTSSPQLSGEVTYDADGRASRLGPLTLGYDAVGNLVRVAHTDGSSVEWGYVGPVRVSRTTTDAAGVRRTVRFDESGFVRDAAGAVTARVLQFPGGVQVVQRSDGAAEWTFATIGGNRWFSTDAAGGGDGSVSLFDPYGNLLTPPPAPLPTPTDGPVVDPRFQSGDTQVLGGVAVQPFGSRLYVPALGRFLQPDPVPGGSANAYGYADADPVNAHDTSGNLPTWAKWTLFGVTVVLAAALTAAAAPAAGAAIGGWVAGGAAVTGKAAVAQVTTSAVVGGIIGGAADTAIQATFTEGFEDRDFDVGQMMISAGIASLFSGIQAFNAVRAGSQQAATTLTANQVQQQGTNQATQVRWARSLSVGSQGSQGSLNASQSSLGNPGLQQFSIVSRSSSLDAQKAALFGRSYTATNLRVTVNALN